MGGFAPQPLWTPPQQEKLSFAAQQGDGGFMVPPDRVKAFEQQLAAQSDIARAYQEQIAAAGAGTNFVAFDTAAEWDSPNAEPAINKYGYIMGDDFKEALNWLLGATPPWGKLRPAEIPARVHAKHGVKIPANVQTGLYMMKGMWEVEKKRRYEASNKALLDEYDGKEAPTHGEVRE
jgi:hypothetical protein